MAPLGVYHLAHIGSPHRGRPRGKGIDVTLIQQIVSWFGNSLAVAWRAIKNHPGVTVAFLGIALAGGLGIRANSERINQIDQASFEASARICKLAVATREDSRREDKASLERARNFVLPTPAELGITDITPGATRYIDQLATSVTLTQVLYYEARLEEFRPLKCVTIHNRRVAVPR